VPGENLTRIEAEERAALVTVHEYDVVLDVTTGAELARVDTESPVQSVLFPTPGFARDVYVCSFTTVSRVAVASR